MVMDPPSEVDQSFLSLDPPSEVDQSYEKEKVKSVVAVSIIGSGRQEVKEKILWCDGVFVV